MSYPSVVLADSPLLYWKLDDLVNQTVAANAGSAAATGTIGSYVQVGDPSNVPSISTAYDNLHQTSMILPGYVAGDSNYRAKQIITAARVPALEVTAAVSVEFTYTFPYDVPSAKQYLVAYGDDVQAPNYGVYIDPSGKISMVIQTTNGSFLTATAPNPLTPGATYHIVITYDSTNAKIYINGVFAVQSPTTTGGAITYVSTTHGFTVGGEGQGSSDGGASGNYGHVLVYGAALTQTQITAHFNAWAALAAATDLTTVTTALAPFVYYRLNELSGTVATDTMGSSNGTYTGGVTLNQPPLTSNNPGASLFDGSTGFVNTNLAATDARLTVSNFTVSAWGYLTGFGNNFPHLVCNGQILPSNDFGFSIHIDTQAFVFRVKGAGGTYVQVYFQNLGTVGPNLFTRYHFVGVIDSVANNISMYVNGVQVSSNTYVSMAGITPTHSVQIGNNAGNGGDLWPGRISEVALFNKALSAAQILSMYQAGVTFPNLPSADGAGAGASSNSTGNGFTPNGARGNG